MSTGYTDTTIRSCGIASESVLNTTAWCVASFKSAILLPELYAMERPWRLSVFALTAPNQFQGYSANNPVEPFWDVAREILILWHAGEREIPEDMVFCSGDRRHQTFRTTWLITEETEYWS